MTVYRGCVLHSLDATSIELLPRGLLFVDRGGRIERLEPDTDGARTRGEKVVDLGDRLILPGLVLHGPAGAEFTPPLEAVLRDGAGLGEVHPSWQNPAAIPC